MTYLQELAAMARIGNNPAYWGTSEQIAAQNDFFDYLDLALTGKITETERETFETYCLKATTDEMLDEGLRLAAIAATRN